MYNNFLKHNKYMIVIVVNPNYNHMY